MGRLSQGIATVRELSAVSPAPSRPGTQVATRGRGGRHLAGSAAPGSDGSGVPSVWAQPASLLAALVLLLWSASSDFTPAGRLVTMSVPIGLGLLAQLVVVGVGTSRGVRTRVPGRLGACAAIIVLVLWLPAPVEVGHALLLLLPVLLLVLGLVVDPVVRLRHARPRPGDILAVAAAAALLTMAGSLAGNVNVAEVYLLGGLRVVLVGLAVILVIDTSRVCRRSLSWMAILVALVTLVVLLLKLAAPSTVMLLPQWPFTTMAAFLATGLVAEVVLGRFNGPSAEMLSQRIDELSRSRRGALDVQASELRRIERDLHDGAQVRLVALSLKLGRAEDRYREDPEIAAVLREAREDAAAAIRELRELGRGIAPPVLVHRGLAAAVESITHRSSSDVTLRCAVGERPDLTVERAAYFVIAESLANAAKHAPGARVEIDINRRGDDLVLEVTDFGPGGADMTGGGLTGLRQRVEALDGQFEVTSPVGVGTQIEAVLPCGR